jgi:hypothetical protein
VSVITIDFRRVHRVNKLLRGFTHPSVCVYKNLSLDPVLYRLKLVFTFIPYFSNVIFNIITSVIIFICLYHFPLLMSVSYRPSWFNDTSLRVKRLEREADHSPTCSTEVMSGGPIPSLIRLHGTVINKLSTGLHHFCVYAPKIMREKDVCFSFPEFLVVIFLLNSSRASLISLLLYVLHYKN